MKLYFLICILWGSVSPVSADIKIPTPESLGFSKSTFSDFEENQIIVYEDLKTRWKIRVTHQKIKSLLDPRPYRQVDIYDDHGKWIEKTETAELYQLKETSWPNRSKVEIRWIKSGQYTKTLYQWDESLGKWMHISTKPLSMKAFSHGCASPLPFEKLEERLSSVLPVLKVDLGLELFGANIKTHGCEKYGSSGVKDLAADLEMAFDRGIRCLSDLQSWKPPKNSGSEYYLSQTPAKPELIAYWRAMAAQMLGYFELNTNRPFTVTCEKAGEGSESASQNIFISNDANAFAQICGRDAEAPGMVLNLFKLNQFSRAERLALLFHELVHVPGLLHEDLSFTTYDAVYGAQFCCFGSMLKGKSEPEMDPTSCANMITKQNAEPYWK